MRLTALGAPERLVQTGLTPAVRGPERRSRSSGTVLRTELPRSAPIIAQDAQPSGLSNGGQFLRRALHRPRPFLERSG